VGQGEVISSGSIQTSGTGGGQLIRILLESLCLGRSAVQVLEDSGVRATSCFSGPIRQMWQGVGHFVRVLLDRWGGGEVSCPGCH
jgi:hypothetical protein